MSSDSSSDSSSHESSETISVEEMEEPKQVDLNDKKHENDDDDDIELKEEKEPIEQSEQKEEKKANQRFISVCVQGIPKTWTAKELSFHFLEYELSRCRVITNKETKESRGFGYIDFDSIEKAQKCIDDNNCTEIEGKKCIVSFASVERNQYKHFSKDGKTTYGHLNDPSNVICFRCNKPGHIGKDCPESVKMGHICYKCNQPGHFAKECPNEAVPQKFNRFNKNSQQDKKFKKDGK